ncbi:hypothetical protein TIFTF001_025409 [Ficus carica]|uniref:Uncharacterized protein n=1 Tax=Ficus carica TaxID=3494 RepID=A0AA88DH87_FICCA|nr:hypothetical protein TIFTF001_025409 [Ficus carica]
MRQLLSEADAETLGQGPLQSHLDDLLWDGLKINVRAMGSSIEQLIKLPNRRSLMHSRRQLSRLDTIFSRSISILVDAEVDEEIKLYEDTLDDAGCSSSAPAEALPTSNVQWPSGEVPASID